mgnify:CR=1 FL=1
MLQFDEYKVKLNNLAPTLQDLAKALDLEAAERELAGKDKNKPVRRDPDAPRNPNVRSLHHIDDEDYESPAEREARLAARKRDYVEPEDETPKQKTAEGHAVRAMYLYCGMADVAHYTNDLELQAACEALFDNVANRRMYITGGIGSSGAGEAFTVDYDLPNLISYTESCAALALALFANRMLRFGADSKYSDVVERVMYNGFLSSLSLDGKSFFYQNP